MGRFVSSTLYLFASIGFVFQITFSQMNPAFVGEEESDAKVGHHEQAEQDNTEDSGTLLKTHLSCSICKRKDCHREQEVQELHEEDIAVHSSSLVGFFLR